jgi:biotin transport system substrate-specific component
MTRSASPVLIDHLSADHSSTQDLVWIVSFSLLTAVLAHIRIPLPYTPVPLTGQTFAVLLSGAVLGCRKGFLSQALYLAEGAAGLPVFAGGAASFATLLGPTGGYLWSFPMAAGLLGWLVERGFSRASWKLAGALIVSDAMILASGACWLRLLYHVPMSQAWVLGSYPFLIGDVLKVVLVGLSLPRILKRLEPSRS